MLSCCFLKLTSLGSWRFQFILIKGLGDINNMHRSKLEFSRCGIYKLMKIKCTEGVEILTLKNSASLHPCRAMLRKKEGNQFHH
jgi:hypothetical protein